MKKTIAFYPFLFALYPIITLYSRNPGEIHPSETVRPLLGALVFAWLLLLLVYLAAQMATADSRAPLLEGLQHSKVRALLEEAGYMSVVDANVWLFTDIRDAQLYLTPYPHALPDFEEFLPGNSILPLFTNSLHQQMPFPSYDTHRKYVTYSLDALADVASVPGPKFVFAHISAPHPPFVFDRAGQPVKPPYAYFLGDASGYQGTQEEYLNGYVNEMVYLNQGLETTLDAILSKSAKPPIIILQGDHGPGMYTNWNSADETCLKERFSILNAYCLPGGTDPLYPAITPVNSFRLIFDKYFQTQLGFLPDKQYFSTRQHPYQFQNITAQSQDACVIP